MTRPPDDEGFSPDWLALREPADARARSGELAARLADLLASRPAGTGRRLVVHDLGCGTGSMGRWLAPTLPGPQHWVLHDRDPDLLARAASSLPRAAADGSPVTAEARVGDLTRLDAADLAGAAVVTASALLDLFTTADVDRLAAACATARCPALLTLSVAGRVELTPAWPIDAAIDAAVGAAFDAHQRREAGERRLLGPDAGPAAAAAFSALGAAVEIRPTPWQLGPDDAALTVEWLRGWLAAAAEQQRGLPPPDYRELRLAQAAAGRLAVVVHHVDLLVTWPAPTS